MRRLRDRHPLLIAWMSLAIALPWQALAADEVATKENESSPAEIGRRTIPDVALQPGGKLHGIVVDANGKPCPQCEVSISRDRRVLAKVLTDDTGSYTTDLPRGGIYQVTCHDGAASFRVWQPTTRTGKPRIPTCQKVPGGLPPSRPRASAFA